MNGWVDGDSVTAEIEMRSVAEWDAVLTRLAISDFAEGPAKAATKAAPLSKANSHGHLAATDDNRGPMRLVSDVVGLRRRQPYRPAMSIPFPIRVNRASVLAFRGTIAAERLGYPSDTRRPPAFGMPRQSSNTDAAALRSPTGSNPAQASRRRA